jgi:hypothetical protein
MSSTKMAGRAASRLLCEACGYDLAGLPADAHCAECGTPVARSLPSRRRGSAWQRRPGAIAWVQTAFAVLRHPRRVWDDFRIEPRRSLSLTLTTFAIASVVMVTFVAPTIPQATPLNAAGGLLVLFGVLLGLTLVEFLGIQLIGRKNKWRITPDVALTVCAHASVGWVVAAVLTGAFRHMAFVGNTDPLPRLNPSAPPIVFERWFLFPIAGFALGLLVFAVLVYLGIRRCRFANAPAAQALSAPARLPSDLAEDVGVEG